MPGSDGTMNLRENKIFDFSMIFMILRIFGPLEPPDVPVLCLVLGLTCNASAQPQARLVVRVHRSMSSYKVFVCILYLHFRAIEST